MLTPMLLSYCLSDSKMVPVAPIITGTTFVFTFHMNCNSVGRSLYFRILTAYFLITFLSPGIATSINLLMPNVNYSGRTAPLTSKVAFYIFIQQI